MQVPWISGPWVPRQEGPEEQTATIPVLYSRKSLLMRAYEASSPWGRKESDEKSDNCGAPTTFLLKA